MMCKSHTGDKDNLNLLTQLIALFTTLHYFLSNKSITNLASDRKEPVKKLIRNTLLPHKRKRAHKA